GIGSAVFHPESSRVARMASGGKHGLAQSLFQVGGNFGSSLGPLMAAFIVLQRGQGSVAWFSIAALIGILILINVGHWYKKKQALAAKSPQKSSADQPPLPAKKIWVSLAILLSLIFSKYFYMA